MSLRKSYDKVLMVDDREPLNFVELVAQNCPIPIDIQRLKTGDYVCEDVTIERKTMSDFASSIIKRRMFTQFERLIKCEHAYILIQGRIAELDSKINPHSILGAIAWLASQGVTLVTVDTEEELAYLILKLLEKHKKLNLRNGWFKK